MTSRTEGRYHVVECSRIDTADAFWRLCSERVQPGGREAGDLGLEAFRDAVLRRGPAWPGPCWIEIRNFERLGSNEPELVSPLEHLAAELEAVDADVRLVLLDLPSPESGPRGGLYQHSDFVSRELRGARVEALLSWSPPPGSGCEMLWLRPEGRPWQRMWLEAGLAFWEEYADQEAFDGFEDVRSEIVDIGRRLGVVGEIVEEVEARYRPDEWWLEIRLRSGRRLRLVAEDARDFDTDVELVTDEAEPRAEGAYVRRPAARRRVSVQHGGRRRVSRHCGVAGDLHRRSLGGR